MSKKLFDKYYRILADKIAKAPVEDCAFSSDEFCELCDCADQTLMRQVVDRLIEDRKIDEVTDGVFIKLISCENIFCPPIGEPQIITAMVLKKLKVPFKMTKLFKAYQEGKSYQIPSDNFWILPKNFENKLIVDGSEQKYETAE